MLAVAYSTLVASLALHNSRPTGVVVLLEFARLPVIQVKIHLAGVAMFECSHLEVDQQVTAKAAVIENEIDIIVLVADRDALLPGFEAEPGAEFEQKTLQVIEQSAFEIGLAVMGFLRQSDEFKHVGIADQIGDNRRRVGGLHARGFDDGLLVSRKAGPLVEHRTDLALKLAHRPVSLEAFVLVKGALPRIVEMQKLDPVGPGKPQDVLGVQASGFSRYGIRHRR